MTHHPLHLVWLRNDLRLHDNPLLQAAARAAGETQLAVVYILPGHWQQPDAQGQTRLGFAKTRFLRACLINLQRNLDAHNIRFSLLAGDPVTLLQQWYERQPFRLYTAPAQAPEEQRWLQDISRFATRHHDETQTLFNPEQLRPLLDGQWPASFTRFRTHLQAQQLTDAIAAPEAPATLRAQSAEPPFCTLMPWPDHLPQRKPEWSNRVPPGHLHGGEEAGLQHLHQYLWQQHAIRHYRDSRNQLCGEGFASQLSPWLAWGALSVRHVWHDIRRWEAQHGASEHSDWLRQELLWREYFHWTLRVKGASLFRNPAPAAFCPQRWQAWCLARTGYPVVDAGLRELMHTGFVANRMRQWLASFFIHELGLDWRLGARFFEQHLIDADVASNWGNWAYIAGCGQDPKGGRHFALNAQLEHYDPHLTHLQQWLPELQPVTLTQVQQHQAGGPLLRHWPAPLK